MRKRLTSALVLMVALAISASTIFTSPVKATEPEIIIPDCFTAANKNAWYYYNNTPGTPGDNVPGKLFWTSIDTDGSFVLTGPSWLTFVKALPTEMIFDITKINKLYYDIETLSGYSFHIGMYNFTKGVAEDVLFGSANKAERVKGTFDMSKIQNLSDYTFDDNGVKKVKITHLYFDCWEMAAADFRVRTFAFGAPGASIYPYQVSGLVMSPGNSESQRNFAWFTTHAYADAIVQVAKKSDMTGSVFPVGKAVTFTGTVTGSQFIEPDYASKVTATGLKPGTEYVYRAGDGKDGHWSPVYEFTTRDDSTNDFNFIYFGDPQIFQTNTASESAAWQSVLDSVMGRHPGSTFIYSAGDLVNQGDYEPSYQGLLAPVQMKQYPFVFAIGNHDEWAFQPSLHFNLPNLSTYGATTAGSDYYFTYGDALFMVLNTNKGAPFDNNEHITFMENAVKEHPNAKWKIVMNHQSPYSNGYHFDDWLSKLNRQKLVPVFEKLGVDAVLSGHEHSYTRSFQMFENTPLKNLPTDENGSIVNPNGAVYFTQTSAVGNKFINPAAQIQAWTATTIQNNRVLYTDVSLTDSTLSLDTYYADSGELFDTYSIKKTVSTDELKELVDDALSLKNEKYATASFNTFKTARKAAYILLADEDATEQQINDAYKALRKSMNALVADDSSVKNVTDLINEIGVIVPDTACKAATESAIAAYDALTEEQQKEVPNAVNLRSAVTFFALSFDDTPYGAVDAAELQELLDDIKDDEPSSSSEASSSSNQSSSSATSSASSETNGEKSSSIPFTGETGAIFFCIMFVSAFGVAISYILKRKRRI